MLELCGGVKNEPCSDVDLEVGWCKHCYLLLFLGQWFTSSLYEGYKLSQSVFSGHAVAAKQSKDRKVDKVKSTTDCTRASLPTNKMEAFCLLSRCSQKPYTATVHIEEYNSLQPQFIGSSDLQAPSRYRFSR
jgi:hypothetical protein